MRLSVMFIVSLGLAGPAALAQDAPVLSVTPVSFALERSLVSVDSLRGFADDSPREVPFSMGEPARAGLEAAPVRRAEPRVVQRSAERRSKKFTIPWMGGVYQ